MPRDPWCATGTQPSSKSARQESHCIFPLAALTQLSLGLEYPGTPQTSSHADASFFTPCPQINLDVSLWLLTLPGPASPSNIDSSLALKFSRASFLCYSFWPLLPRAASASRHHCFTPNGTSKRIQALPYALVPSPLSFKVFPLSHPTGAQVISCRNPRLGGGATCFFSFPSNSQLPPLLYFWFATQLPLNFIF